MAEKDNSCRYCSLTDPNRLIITMLTYPRTYNVYKNIPICEKCHINLEAYHKRLKEIVICIS